jgi:DNA-binding XRE family transcriptional regulator
MTRDRFAARQVRSHRIDLGLSPEQLGCHVGVSGHTIRRIERDACVPTPRVQFLIAQHFGLKPTELWSINGARRQVAA